jgi:hypothetical protein
MMIARASAIGLCGITAALGMTAQLWAAPPSVAELRETVKSATGLARRQAARKLIERGREAEDAVMALAKDEDVVIRRNALRRLRTLFGTKAVPLYKDALQDPSPLVRLVAVEELMAYEPRTPDVMQALTEATQDTDDEVRKLAAGAFWTFHRDYVTLRKRPNWDHAIEVIASKALPMDGWRFRTDPGRVGHVEGWFEPSYDDSAWHETIIGKWWHEALPEKVGHFEGIAWYRVTFDAPAKPEGEFNEAVLHFESVDESTWVWVNGQYAGEHDMGPGGWNVPFDVEVGTFIKWGQPNQITVRVMNTAGAGGIYKPVEFQVLK